MAPLGATWDPEGDPPTSCWGCSTDHADEFGGCTGTVEGLMFLNVEGAEEVDVRWSPSNLRYGYHPSMLDVVGP